ncbi:hypothetical protein BASA81_000192 [Batrachochytrium salamandrivorans]|nr:hypothetical protein BASA81_000192 [Batrachochytrium salamandrivorans]
MLRLVKHHTVRSARVWGQFTPSLSAVNYQPHNLLVRTLRSSNVEPERKPRSITIKYTKQQEGEEVPPQSHPPQQLEPEDKPQEQGKVAKFLSRFGWLGAGVLFMGGKGKVLLFSALKFGKLGSLLSIFASTAAYSMIYGLPFGAGLVGLLIVHELGHIMVLQSLGVPFKPMFLVPFMGAFVSHEQPMNAYDHAKVALGGPAVGGLASLAVAVTGQTLDSQFLIALGDFGLYLNLINLLPIGSLDGGVITGSLSRWFLVGGLGVGGAMFATGAVTSPMFALILVMGGFSTVSRFFGAKTEEEREYYEIPRNEKIIIGTSYAALVAGLAVAHGLNSRHKKSPNQIRREIELEQRQRGEALPAPATGFQKQVFEWSQDPDAEVSHLEANDLWFQNQRK